MRIPYLASEGPLAVSKSYMTAYSQRELTYTVFKFFKNKWKYILSDYC